MSISDTAAVMAASPEEGHRGRSFSVKRSSSYRVPVPQLPRLSEDIFEASRRGSSVPPTPSSGAPLTRTVRQASIDAEPPKPALGWRLLGAVGRAWRALTCQSSAA